MIFNFSKFLNDINYDPNTDRPSKRRELIRTKLIDWVQKILNPRAALAIGESDEYESPDSDSESKGTKTFFIPSDSYAIWIGSQNLLGLKLSGHTDTLKEASQLKDALYKRGEIETEQQYHTAIDKVEYIIEHNIFRTISF